MTNLLTDKTLPTFERWYFETHCKSSIKFEDLLLWQKSEVFDWLYSRCETIQYAFMIEFFDSVGIYIEITKSADIFWLYDIKINNAKVYISALDPMQRNRQEATEKAIEHANEIFNNR